MIELEIVALLKGCKDLIDLLGGEYIYPGGTEHVESIFYTVTPITSDKLKERYRVQITSILSDDYKALQIREILKGLLLTKVDEPLTDKILQCVQTGGSNPIFNEQYQAFNTITIFEMIRRV